MVTVPRYGERIETERLPAARASIPQSEEAFGGGASARQVGEAAGGLLLTAANIMKAEKQKADDSVILEGRTKMQILLTDLDTEMAKRTGKNALGTTEYVTERFQKGVDEIKSSFVNDDQRRAFAPYEMQALTSAYDKSQAHTLVENDKYNTELYDAFMEGEQNYSAMNYKNPEILVRSEEDQLQALLKRGEEKGWSDEKLVLEDDNRRSQKHVKILQRALLNGDFGYAEEYEKKFKHEIIGDEAKAIVADVKQEAVRLQKIQQYEKNKAESLKVLNGDIDYFAGLKKLESGEWTLPFFNSVKSDLLHQGYDSKLPFDEQYSAYRGYLRKFGELGKGEGKGEVDFVTYEITKPVENEHLENLDTFRNEVMADRRLKPEWKEQLIAYTQLNYENTGTFEAKEKLFDKVMSFFDSKIAPLLEQDRANKERIAANLSSNLFNTFNPKLSVKEAEAATQKAIDSFVSATNPNKALYPVDTMINTPSGTFKVIGHDIDGEPILEIPQ